MNTATTQNDRVRFHYIRNRDPKVLHKVKDGMSRGVPIACIASRIDRDAKVIEYAVATAHVRRVPHEDIVINRTDLGMEKTEFRAFTKELVELCRSRGVKAFTDNGIVSIARERKPFDTFSYEGGRKIALGRLKVSQIDIPYKNEPKNGKEILHLILNSIAKDPMTPTRVAREALALVEYKNGVSVGSNVVDPISDLVELVNDTDAEDKVETVEATTESRLTTLPPAPGNVRKVPRYEVNFETKA